MNPRCIQLSSDRYLALTFAGVVKGITGKAPLVESDAAVYHSLKPKRFKPTFISLDIVSELDQQCASDRLKAPFALLLSGEKIEGVFIDPRGSVFVATHDHDVLEACGIPLYSLRAYSGLLSRLSTVPHVCDDPKVFEAAFIGTRLDETRLAELIANEERKIMPPHINLHTSDVTAGSESWRIKKTELIVGLAELQGLRVFLGRTELMPPNKE